MEGLGRLFDIGNAISPVDLDTANAATGKRIAVGSVGNAITVVLHLAAQSATDLVIDVVQHTAYTGGTSKDLEADVVAGVAGSTALTHYYIKSEATLDNDEAWARVATTADTSEITLTGATYGDKECIVVLEIRASQLAEGYSHVSVNVSSTIAATKPISALYFVHELRYQRQPAKLRNLLRPSAANA